MSTVYKPGKLAHALRSVGREKHDNIIRKLNYRNAENQAWILGFLDLWFFMFFFNKQN